MVLSDEKKRDFLALHSQCNCHKTPCEETLFMTIWDVNSFELTGFEVENISGPENLGVFKVASRINHACIPNASRRFTKAMNIVIISSEDIKKGDEITIDYEGACSVPVAMRRAHFLEKYGFHCRCRGCVSSNVLPWSAMLKEWEGVKKPIEVTTPEILGEQTVEEVAALAEVDSWYRLLESYIVELQKKMAVVIRRDFITGYDTREEMYGHCETLIRNWLREKKTTKRSEREGYSEVRDPKQAKCEVVGGFFLAKTRRCCGSGRRTLIVTRVCVYLMNRYSDWIERVTASMKTVSGRRFLGRCFLRGSILESFFWGGGFHSQTSLHQDKLSESFVFDHDVVLSTGISLQASLKPQAY